MKKVKIVFLCIAGMLLGYVACMSVFGTYGHEGVNSGQDFVFVPDAKRNVLFRGSVDDYLKLKKFYLTWVFPLIQLKFVNLRKTIKEGDKFSSFDNVIQ